jgi:hypothetical protein
VIVNSIEKPVQEERTAESEMSTEKEVKGKKNSVDNSFVTEKFVLEKLLLTPL